MCCKRFTAHHFGQNFLFAIYKTEDGVTKIDVRVENETVWLSLDQLADLFQRDKSTISRHIKNIFEEGELQRESVVANFATTATDGKTYQVDYYNLDVIISVGYRVKSLRGTQFRIWANNVLKEYPFPNGYRTMTTPVRRRRFRLCSGYGGEVPGRG